MERWAWINHVAFPDLSPAERAAFIRAYLGRIKRARLRRHGRLTQRGWPAGAVLAGPVLPYPRAVNLVSWTFNPAISLAGIPVVYEIQA